jgi:biopolymer transport protein ExbD
MKFTQNGNAARVAKLSLTSMIDVVFLLLVFFMLGMQFRREERRMEAALPRQGQGTDLGRLEELHIAVDRGPDGAPSLLLDGRVVSSFGTLESLLRRIARVPGAADRTRVLLDATGAARHGWVLRVLDVARTVGFRQVAFRR